MDSTFTHLPVSGRRSYLKYKEEARKLVHSRLIFFNQFYNLSYKRVSIKNQKRVWGSCSKRGNLNFNYKILFLPPEVADYIVVHELCHLKEMNHGKNFWLLVEKTLPNWRELRGKLKKIYIR